MEIDVKKTVKTPSDKFQAVDFMNEYQQKLVDAIHIMISFIENPDELEFHNKRMNEFVKPFIK